MSKWPALSRPRWQCQIYNGTLETLAIFVYRVTQNYAYCPLSKEKHRDTKGTVP